MRIIFFTRKGFETNELFLYMYARVAAQFPDCCIVAVHPPAERSMGKLIRRHWNKMRRLGFWTTLEILSSYPLQRYFGERDSRERARLLRALPRPGAATDPKPVTVVTTVNGADAVEAIRRLSPDIILQAGAGILKAPLFQLPSIACLNLHHGIAPLIRGMNSIYWGLWERRPEWIGSTVHEIDAGIDTGKVLAYAPVKNVQPGDGFAQLFVRATEQGVDRLLDVLSRLQNGERWSVAAEPGESAYRSTISGWQMAALAWRIRGERQLVTASQQAARS